MLLCISEVMTWHDISVQVSSVSITSNLIVWWQHLPWSSRQPTLGTACWQLVALSPPSASSRRYPAHSGTASSPATSRHSRSSLSAAWASEGTSALPDIDPGSPSSWPWLCPHWSRPGRPPVALFVGDLTVRCCSSSSSWVQPAHRDGFDQHVEAHSMEGCEEWLVAWEVAEDMQLDLAVVGFTGLEPTPHIDSYMLYVDLNSQGEEEEEEEAVVGLLKAAGEVTDCCRNHHWDGWLNEVRMLSNSDITYQWSDDMTWHDMTYQSSDDLIWHISGVMTWHDISVE